VSEDGRFDASYNGLLAGDYFFALRVEDKDGRKTGIRPFPIASFKDELIAENLLMPPTIGFFRATVRKGDPLTVMGYSAPESIIEAEVDGWPLQDTTKSNADGFYKILVPTSDLSFGEHRIQLRQQDKNGEKSDFSLKKIFTVSRLVSPETDLNNDDRININDWSIFLFLFNSEDKEQKIKVDFNEDNKVDLSDFAIFIKTVKL
jgi:hypothetical protein